MKLAIVIGAFVLLALVQAEAAAQQPYTPGTTPEPAKEWTYYVSWLIAPLSVAVIALIGLFYVRLSSRFFGKEEPPAPGSRRPRYPTGSIAPPVSAGPRVEQQGAASTTPPAAPASEVQTAKEQEPKPSAAPERQAAAAAPKAEGTPATTTPAEAPAEKAAGTPPRDEPATEPKTEAGAQAPPAPAAAPAAPAATEHVEPDQEVYERELQSQLDKGTDRRVAEGRAKAAAIRAARASAAAPAEAATPSAPAEEPKPKQEIPSQEGGGEPTQPPEHTPNIPAGAGQPTPEGQRPEADRSEEQQKEAAAASTEAQAKVKEPERVIDAPTPEQDAKEAETPPAQVDAPAPEAKPAATEPADAERPAAPPGGDEETFNRILEEQLGKGLARPIAESRARAAAIKAAREKSGG